MRIFVVRHAESLGNVDESTYQHTVDPNVPLTQFGYQKQAVPCGEFLRTQCGDSKPRIYYSPFVRTDQTKDGIVEGFGGKDKFEKIYEDPFLIEQDFGIFSLVTDNAERERLFPEEYKVFRMLMESEHRFYAKGPGGESRLDVVARVRNNIDSIMRDAHEGVQDFIIVTHGVTSRAFEMSFMHRGVKWFEKSRNPHNCDVVLIEGDREHGYKASKVYEGAKRTADMALDFMTAAHGDYVPPISKTAAIVEAVSAPATPLKEPTNMKPTIIQGDDAKSLWLPQFPWPTPDGHKYTRGHVVIVGGPLGTSGAAKLSGTSALRTAAGAVTILAPDENALNVYVASSDTKALMWGTYDRLPDLLNSKLTAAVIVGPGFGQGKIQEQILDAIVASGKPTLMDADALRTPRYNPKAIITPHEGEFARMFPQLKGTREENALAAAEMTGSVVLLKGRETVIASPDGRIAINSNATPWLATAGSGDTLSGIIGSQVGAGMDPFLAAVAGAYIHGQAGINAGRGLIADDLVDQIPAVLNKLAVETAKSKAADGNVTDLKNLQGSRVNTIDQHLL